MVRNLLGSLVASIIVVALLLAGGVLATWGNNTSSTGDSRDIKASPAAIITQPPNIPWVPSLPYDFRDYVFTNVTPGLVSVSSAPFATIKRVDDTFTDVYIFTRFETFKFTFQKIVPSQIYDLYYGSQKVLTFSRVDQDTWNIFSSTANIGTIKRLIINGTTYVDVYLNLGAGSVKIATFTKTGPGSFVLHVDDAYLTNYFFALGGIDFTQTYGLLTIYHIIAESGW